MKSHGEGCSWASDETILTAQIIAVGGEEQLPGIDQAEAFAVTVMGAGYPLLAFVLSSLSK